MQSDGGVTHNDRALCRCGISIPSAHNRCPAFAKDKYLEPMFGDVGQARTNAAMLLMPIAATSSHTCTKPIVRRSFNYISNIIYCLSINLLCLCKIIHYEKRIPTLAKSVFNFSY